MGAAMSSTNRLLGQAGATGAPVNRRLAVDPGGRNLELGNAFEPLLNLFRGLHPLALSGVDQAHEVVALALEPYLRCSS